MKVRVWYNTLDNESSDVFSSEGSPIYTYNNTKLFYLLREIIRQFIRCACSYIHTYIGLILQRADGTQIKYTYVRMYVHRHVGVGRSRARLF